VPLGLVSGYLGGRLDRVLLFDGHYLHLPGLLSVTLAFVVGRNTECRDRYQHCLTSPVPPRCPQPHPERKTELFIEAAQAAPPAQTQPHHLNAADAILTLGALGLGLGLPEEVPEWGHDLRQALEAATGIWWTTLFLV